jgi:glutamate/tyrosine decarboxylase-like PLP-dependent enzyme
MHTYTPEIDDLAKRIFDFARKRTDLDAIPLGAARTEADLAAACGPTVTTDGLGGAEALRVFTEVLHDASLSVDYTRYLSFVPAAPTEASVLFDLVVGACSIYGGSWIEGAGAVHAENEALRWFADLAGLPADAGGVFVPGGTIGNLSAMVAARGQALERVEGARPDRWVFLASSQAHSSVKSGADVMDADVVAVAVEDDLTMSGAAVGKALDRYGDRVAGVVATAGTTNLGLIDDLRGIGEACHERNVWFHVDGAYGGAALAAPSTHGLFDGVELADSLIVDPHKWLFAPFDCCALLYREPARAQAVHAQHAGYLRFLNEWGDWNPSDFAIHLTQRARGLPFWFSLATHGTDAYDDAVQVTLDLAQAASRRIDAVDHLELAHTPSLSVVVFRRLGWDADQYTDWTVRTMKDGTAFVVPSRYQGEPVFRFCFVNPRTTVADIDIIIDALA